MKIALPLVLLSLVALESSAQNKINGALKRELDSLYVVDQRYREMIMSSFTRRGADSVAAVLGMSTPKAGEYLTQSMMRTDSSNIRRVSKIIEQHGYPGKSLVGTPTNETAFYVIQHSPLIKRYLPQVKKAADTGELPFRLYAMMLDRQLMNDGKAQVYGTQARSFTAQNAATGRPEQQYVIWPVEDAAGVNVRRKKAGFPQTVEENAKRLRAAYDPKLSLKQVAEMMSH